MSDRLFKWSLTTLAGVVLIWLLICTILATQGKSLLGFGWEILIGLIILIIGGGALLYFWGKSYMSRV